MRSSSGGSSSTNTTSCQDCGNKAKRDCEHTRCRTCCKSRSFQCATHVKSTWVPVARRRQRRQQQQQHQQQQQQHPQLRLSATSLDHFNQYLPLPLSLSLSNIHQHTPTSAGLEGGNFPAEVNSSATFRCIRVSSEDNVVDQYAYQTSISVGGHVFKGVLYDQGPTTARRSGETSSIATSDNHPFNISASTVTVAATHPGGGGENLYHPPSLYSGPSFNAFLPGMQFFPHPRP